MMDFCARSWVRWDWRVCVAAVVEAVREASVSVVSGGDGGMK